MIVCLFHSASVPVCISRVLWTVCPGINYKKDRNNLKKSTVLFCSSLIRRGVWECFFPWQRLPAGFADLLRHSHCFGEKTFSGSSFSSVFLAAGRCLTRSKVFECHSSWQCWHLKACTIFLFFCRQWQRWNFRHDWRCRVWERSSWAETICCVFVVSEILTTITLNGLSGRSKSQRLG